MRVALFVSAVAMALTASIATSAAADRASGVSNEAFSALRGVQATPMNRGEMDEVRGAFNLFLNRNGSVVYVGTHGGNFQSTSGLNNVIVGCGGGPKATTISSHSC